MKPGGAFRKFAGNYTAVEVRIFAEPPNDGPVETAMRYKRCRHGQRANGLLTLRAESIIVGASRTLKALLSAAPSMSGLAMLGVLLSATSAVASGDLCKGEGVFIRQCALCHSIGKNEPHRFGPNLFGVVDRKAGSARGYRYSQQFLKMANWTWSPDGIASFVAAPALTIPGNKMSVFQGVADADMDDLIAYLSTQK